MTDRKQAEKALTEFDSLTTTTSLERRLAAALRSLLSGTQEDRWEYVVYDAEGDLWALTDSLEEAGHYLLQEPGGRIERHTVGPWEPVPVEEER